MWQQRTAIAATGSSRSCRSCCWSCSCSCSFLEELHASESERDGSIAANYSKINTRLICKSCIHFCASILCSGSLALWRCVAFCVHAVCLSESFMVFNLPSDVRPTRTTRTTTLRATCQCHRSARVHSQRQRVRGNHGHFIFLSIFPPPFPFAVRLSVPLSHCLSPCPTLLMLSCISFNGRHCCC